MLAPDARTLSTCVTDGRPDGSLLHPIVFGGSGNDCFHLLAPVTSHRHVFCNSAVEHLLVLAVQQAVVGGIEGQPFPIYDHVEPIVQQVSLAAGSTNLATINVDYETRSTAQYGVSNRSTRATRAIRQHRCVRSARTQTDMIAARHLSRRRGGTHGICHCRATFAERLLTLDRRVLSRLVLDLPIQFRADQNYDGGNPQPHHQADCGPKRAIGRHW
jgi:hypothetical protein